MEIQIRKGTKKDLPEILELINELAVYEKAPNEVTITLEELEKDGFGDEVYYQVFVAEELGSVIGMALCYPKYSTWKGKCIFLEDIVVRENKRRNGVGGKLFDAVVNEAKNFGAKRMEWQVLDWNIPAIEFYKKYNANFDEEWINVRLMQDQIKGKE